MALQLSTAVRNARLDAIESTAGTGPTLEIRTGAPPANAGAADSGTLIGSTTLPTDWLADAASGSKAKAGTWEIASADASGTAGHFRIKAGATTHIQGTVGEAADSPDLELDNKAINEGQKITVSTFTLTDANA